MKFIKTKNEIHWKKKMKFIKKKWNSLKKRMKNEISINVERMKNYILLISAIVD